MIGSFGMALRYSFGLVALADRIEAAIAGVLDKGLRTADIAGTGEGHVSTTQMGRCDPGGTPGGSIEEPEERCALGPKFNRLSVSNVLGVFRSAGFVRPLGNCRGHGIPWRLAAETGHEMIDEAACL